MILLWNCCFEGVIGPIVSFLLNRLTDRGARFPTRSNVSYGHRHRQTTSSSFWFEDFWFYDCIHLKQQETTNQPDFDCKLISEWLSIMNDEDKEPSLTHLSHSFVIRSVRIFPPHALVSRSFSQSFKHDTLQIKADVQNLSKAQCSVYQPADTEHQRHGLTLVDLGYLWTLVTWLKKKHVRWKNLNDMPLPVFPALKKLKLVF